MFYSSQDMESLLNKVINWNKNNQQTRNLKIEWFEEEKQVKIKETFKKAWMVVTKVFDFIV